ncbi:TIGR02444 family protein [Nisaea acidiphila]|uniref:TIGR02444 family protein n=1 Tax=Nisaea acidiphila TaxID=1862145 RepID=A0A9J7AX47_9PROT|nr:TIGR02444 family protein [Nisaea acidiphila]UUX51001.1 TIGR02444 family protein [Nisaea acidiphila]
MRTLENPFWSYSLSTYARENVAAECLSLQDREGLDVNLLLLCCWLGSRGTEMSAEDIRRAITAAGDWSLPVIGPIRAVRRHLKPLAEDEQIAAFRKQVAALELAAEQIQQAQLFAETRALAPGKTEPAIAAAANLRLYASLTKPGRHAEIQESLLKLLCAAFPDAMEVDIVSTLADPASE